MTTTTAPQTSSFSSEVITPLFLGLNLAAFLALGGIGFFGPYFLAGQLDITLGSTSALADFRAMYGGLPLGIAGIIALGMKNAALRHPAVLLSTLTAGGLALGRLFTMATVGLPGPLVLVSLASEVLAVGCGIYLLKK
ncbi:MAG: DUF4345 domain-containing protein [Archangium sp.]|nr:DUF4345 domain-containing protein [Archangium sp.]